MNLMRLFKKLSIKHKLILIMMTTSCTAITLMAALIVVNQTINSQRAIQQQLIALADVLGSTSTGALSFDDPAAGAEILNALALKSNIEYAVIERPNGDIFAEFSNGVYLVQPFYKPLTVNEKTRGSGQLLLNLLANKLQVTRGIYLENERIGTIRIVSTMNEFHRDLLHYVFLIVVLSCACFIVTFIVCSRLQRIISGPIVNLHNAMNIVSDDKDYSLRVKNDEINEFGSLVNGFNHMLEQIQLRDTKLAEYRAHLEQTVIKRTQELTESNRKRIMWLEMMADFLRHELKNSYVGIKSSLDLIERRSENIKKIDVYLARARTSMTNMNALLQSAGEASNLEAILYKEKHERLDLTVIVLNHMPIYSSIYPDFPISMHCRRGVYILGNEVRIKQLLDKLINNAVEHTTPNTTIDVIVTQQDEKALLIVKNTGDVLPEDKRKIFDLFVSLRTEERKTDDNFGLGLYIVKLITESHGGQVSAHDLKGNETGAYFKVEFPILRDKK